MSRYLRYAGAGHVTGSRLGDYMGIPNGRNDTDQEDRIDYLIRWGYRGGARWKPAVTTINKRSAMNAASGRRKQLRAMRRAGIKTPRFARDPEGLATPMLGRMDGGGQTMGGDGIVFIDDIYDAPDCDLYTEWIEKDREFRAHVIAGRVVKLSEKIPNDAADRQKAVWNFDNGFTFRNPQGDVPQRVKIAAVNAVSTFDLDFGAVDIILNGHTPYVLEVNTAPGLIDNNVELYARHLGRLVGLTPDDMPGWEAAEREDAA